MYQDHALAAPAHVDLNGVMHGSRPPDASASGASAWDVAADAHARWRTGDGAALDELVHALTPILWQAARSYGLSEDAARDVVQNAWLSMVRTSQQVRDSQAIGGWLLTTTRRLAWRSTQTREIPVDEWTHPMPDRSPTPEDATIAGIEARTLWRAVAELDERCRRLLRIIAFDDRPDYAALSAETGMPIGSIGPTRRRCLDKLRRSLEGTPT